MGRGRPKFGEGEFPHFPTCTVVGWLPDVTQPDTVRSLLDSWQFLQDKNDPRLSVSGSDRLDQPISRTH